ncbi:MAG: hypothetical protein D6729_05215 [Deltaproteobacteria bacterium]|nr:MAG: hypothetical protein D6729_05215 [Deltaproteobacteria bacterium]
MKFFGQFLLERGVVSRDALVTALELQDERNMRLGAYAVRRGYMTEADAERLNHQQLTVDRRFGELAVEAGLLTPEQVQELLTLQQNDYLLLGEALLELGQLDRATLERELKAFKDDQARYLVDDVVFPPGVRDASLLALPVDLTAKILLRTVGLTTKIGEGERERRPPVDRLFSVTVHLSGSLMASYTLSVSRDIAEAVFQQMTGGESPRDDAEIVDALKELCNVICGNATARMAQAGRVVEISPPEEGAPEPPEGGHYVLFPLHVAEGAIEVRITQ